MRDLHSHYLPGVDDGSKNIEMTENMLKLASDNGVTDIMFTPHYIVDSRYISDTVNNKKIFKEVQSIAKKYNINIYLGNEVYCTTQILDNLKNKKIMTLNNSRYMLIEIPMYNKLTNVNNIFYDLIINGITPILAHPERYTAYYRDFSFFEDITNMGVLLQINYTSLVGKYGRKAKEMAKKLLKRHMISFVGSDVHNEQLENYNQIEKALKLIKKYDKLNYEDIVNNNFMKVINNESINTD